MKTICIKSSMLIIYLIMNSLKKLQHHLQIWLCAVLKRQLYIVFVGDTKPNQQHSCPEKPTSGAQKSAFEWTRYTQEGVRVVGTRWSLNSLSTQTILWFCDDCWAVTVGSRHKPSTGLEVGSWYSLRRSLGHKLIVSCWDGAPSSDPQLEHKRYGPAAEGGNSAYFG